MLERSATAEILEGSVKKVDPGAGTLEMSDSTPGAMSRTLAIVAETLVAVDGAPGHARRPAGRHQGEGGIRAA